MSASTAPPRSPAVSAALRAQFAVRQAARIGWYTAQNLAGVRLARQVAETLPKVDAPVIEAPAGIPERPELLRHVRKLMQADLANVEAGFYPMPDDEDGGLPGMVARRRRYLSDVPKVMRRRALKIHQEPNDTGAPRPRYYRQNFHFQTDGWLSDDSAALYDTQVETLFFGAAAAMRRQALVPIAEMVRERDQRSLKMLDVASGAGAFLRDVRRAFPRLPVIASDLSEPYTRRARTNLASLPGSGATVAAGEALPFADQSLDIVSNIYLFHELPPAVRGKVAAEMARVVAPGGKVILVDSLQTGDTPALDGLLELFPQMFHEPYYRSYQQTDIAALFVEAGLTVEAVWPAFVSKVFVFSRGCGR